MNLNESLIRINSFGDNSKNDINENYEIIINDDIYLQRNILYRLWNNKNKIYLFLNKNHYSENSLLKNFNKYEIDLYNIKNYFPGKYFQIIKSRNQEYSIKNIFIDNYTNAGWGLLSEYYMINQINKKRREKYAKDKKKINQ